MTDNQQSLDVMQKTIELVLIEIGKTIRTAKNDGQSTNTTDTSIPKLNDKFQYAIDDIEEEIVRAKSILHRDLQQRQAKRAAAEQPKAESVPTPGKPSEILPEAVPSAPISIFDFGAGASQFGGDGTSETTLDRLQKSIGDAQKIVRSPGTTGKESKCTTGVATSSSQPNPRVLPNESLFQSPTETKDQAEKQTVDDPKTLGTNAKEEESKDNPQEMDTSEPNNEAAIGNTQENLTDLDSLFDGNNSNSNTNQSDNADFAEIDFTAGGDFTFPTTTAAPSNAGLDSLMPGIESYAAGNQSEDFNMLDFPTNTDTGNGNGNTNADTTMDPIFDFPDNNNNTGSGAAGGNSSNNIDLGISTESNFDDLLDGMDFGDADDGTGGGGAGMEHGEFDDAFFGLT